MAAWMEHSAEYSFVLILIFPHTPLNNEWYMPWPVPFCYRLKRFVYTPLRHDWTKQSRLVSDFSRDSTRMAKYRMTGEDQREIKVELQEIISRVPGPLQAVPNKVFLFVIHAEPEIQVEAIDPLEVARRLTSSICHQQLELFQAYLAYKFAFPERVVPWMERAPELLEALLRLALAGKESYLVLHPDPVSMPALFESMLPFVKDAPKT
jgi:hypothetical protein